MQLNLRLNVRREVLFMWLYSVLCILGMVNMGITTGYSSVTLPALTSNTSSITLSASETPLFVSMLFICEIVGSFVTPIIMMRYGRRCSMMASGAACILGYILIATSYTVAQLFAGRVLTGIAMGLGTTPIFVYVEEISILSWKGFLTMTPNIATGSGFLVVYFLGFFIQNDWKLIAALCIVPSTLSVLCNIFIPESPAWLLTKNRKEEARIALLRIRGLHQETTDFQKEFARLVSYIELKSSQRSDACSTEEGSSLIANVRSKLEKIQRTIRLPEVWKPFVILNLYFLFQQFSGVSVILVYTVNIISNIIIAMDPFLITVIMGILQVIAVVITTCCSGRVGRRTISIVSGIGMSVSLIILVVYMQCFEDTDITAIPLVCIFVYVVSGSLGFLPIPWAMMGELYPTRYISILGPVTEVIVVLFTFLITQLYPMMAMQGKNVTIYFYCIMSVTGTVFLTIVLPETLGKTKTQIEDAFRGKSQIED